MARSGIIRFLFWITILLELLLILFGRDEWRWATKPLLMPLLMGILWIEKKNAVHFSLLIGALFLSWCGDVLLQMKGLFIPGLVSFLLAHVCYIIYFVKRTSGKTGLLKKKPLLTVPVLIYILVFLYLLFPYLGALKLPVTVYGITIGTMLLTSIHTKGTISHKTSLYFILGAVLFVTSDSILAVNLFAMKHLGLSLAVMLTYAAAQYLIVSGAILQETKKD